MDSFAKALVLVARLAGLGLFVYIMSPVRALVGEAWDLQHIGGLRPLTVVGVAVRAVPTIVLLALALHLTLGGRWLIVRMLRGLDGTCPACGQPLPDQGTRCTECGFRFKRPA